MNDLVIPLVNLNGTSRDELMHQLQDAANAVLLAQEKLALAAPHGRDYPKVGRLGLAVAQHDKRMTKLREVREELEHIAMEIL